MYPYIYIVLPSYSLMAFIGGFLSLLFMYFRIEKYDIEFKLFIKVFILCLLGGFLGSKLIFAITQIPWLIKNFSLVNLILLIPNSGFVFYGGLLGVIFTIFIFTRNKLELRDKLLKIMAPAIPLFHSFGRIGCFLAGCCYGKLLKNPLIIGGIIQLNRVPIQLIESLYEFLLFLLIVILGKKKKILMD